MIAQESYLGLFYPWSLIIALLIAVVFAVVGILIFKRGMTKASKPVLPEIDLAEFSPWRSKIRDILARYGYFPTDPLSASFVRALRVLQSFVGGHQFRYQLPWYMVIGAEGSGKSSILNSLDLNLPVGRPHFGETTDHNVKPECDWWFYDHGVVLDVDGKLVIEEKDITSDEEKWDMLLDLLSHHRPKRPLDGLVVTISCEELIGDKQLDYDDLRLRSEYIYMKLWQLQKKTGLRLPVYITVTKCDLIPGFQTFCNALPKGREREIFGWSNQSALDTTYEPKWVDDAFESIRLNLYRIQQNIFASGDTYTSLDGIFKFPFNFSAMKENLGVYINHLFKTSGYHEGLYLRGIYFTGDSGSSETAADRALDRSEKREKELEVLLDVEQDVFGDEAEEPGSRPASLRHTIYFADDLFEKRVFRELGIARPISTALLGNTSAMRVAKIGVASGTVVATLGLLNAADNLGASRASLLPALVQINDTLSAVQGQSPTSQSGRLFFQQQAENLLQTMDQMQANSLTSAFIPASWFSRVNDDLTDVMAVAFNEVIFESISTELTDRADNLVSLATSVPIYQTVSDNGDPLKTEEFYRLQNYVINVHILALSADKFNNIGITANLEELADLIFYLFQMRMPQAFFENDIYYQRALGFTKVKVFDFDTYKAPAIAKLRKLYDEYELVAFDPNVVIPGLRSLGASLKSLEENRNVATYSLDNLRAIAESLTKTINSLDSSTTQWIALDNYTPGLAYEHMMSTISASFLLGPDVASQLTAETAKRFSKFQASLAQYRSPLMGGTLLMYENGKLVDKPSDGAVKLQGILNMFYAEKFMRKAGDAQIMTRVPEGSILLWDSLRLGQATDMIKAYNDFVNTKLLNYPKSLQPLMQKVAAESLVANLTELTADAQVFSTQITNSFSSSPEDALLSQVQNYRATAESLKKILLTLQANSGNEAYAALRCVVTEQNYALLTKLDNILDQDTPYAIKDNGFSWWTGNALASLEAFGVSSQPELKGYLELQRERIRYLAMEFAAPLVSFLKEVNQQAMPGNLPLVSKWGNIISELEGYDKKAKGNGLSMLEEYIEKPLSEVTLSSCDQYASTETPITSQNSYFVGILNTIQYDLYEQCQNLAGVASTSDYNKLETFFNANLSGRFPFVADGQGGQAPEADPNELRAFFDLIDDKAKDIKQNLQQAASNLGSAGKRALEFIKDMEDVRTFFGGYLAAGSKMPFPQFDFTVDFRVNRRAERAGNQVVDWFVNVQDTKIDFRSKDTGGHWNLNDPISVGFRWAANSPEQPQLAGDNSALSVFNGTATFSYGGKWGLVRLLKAQAAPLTDFQNQTDNQPQTLVFNVPLKDLLSTGSPTAASAKLFIRFKVKPILQEVDSKTGAVSYKPGAEVTLPTFPVSAPKLSGV